MQGATMPLPFDTAPERPWPAGTPEAWALGDRFPLGPDGLLHRVEELCSAHDRAASAEWTDFPRRLRVTATGWTASLCTLTGEWRATRDGRRIIARIPSLRLGVRTPRHAAARVALLGELDPRLMPGGPRATVAALRAVHATARRYPVHITPDEGRIVVSIERADYLLNGEPDGSRRTVSIVPDGRMWRLEFDADFAPGDTRECTRHPELVTEMTIDEALRKWCGTKTGRVV